MSIGIGAHAIKVLEDDCTVIYSYSSFNLNDPRFMNKGRISDGLIYVSKPCFIEPEIHRKVNRLHGGRKKLIEKRIVIHADYHQLIKNGDIVVENCSNCWRAAADSHADIMAYYLLFRLFQLYQETGSIPTEVSYYI